MQVSLLQRPTLTSGTSKDQAHVKILDPDIYIYNSYEELKQVMLSLSQQNTLKADFAGHYEPYSPNKVMTDFNIKFFDGRLVQRPGAPNLGQKIDLKILFGQQPTAMRLP